METSEQTEGTATDDPFEGGPAADPFEEASAAVPGEDIPPDVAPADTPAEAAAEEEAEEEAIPVVDREGNEVKAEAEETPAEKPPNTQTAAGRAKAAAEAGDQPDEEGAESDEEGAQGDEGGDEGAAPLSNAERTQAASSQDGGDGNETAASGKQTRFYKLLYQTGETGWNEADLSSAPADQKKVIDGEEFLVARNNDHARRLAFNILGRPEAGVTVNPIAKASWKPKRVRVAPPKPDRERLEIG